MQASIPLLPKRKARLCAPLCLDSRAQELELEWVLLLDDDLVTSRGVSRWVRHAVGVDTRVARTVHQAECWLRSMPPPVAIITDFDLQLGQTGAAALKRFRRAGLTQPAMVLTGAPSRARAALDEAGMTEIPVLSKTQFQRELRMWLLGQREWRARQQHAKGSRSVLAQPLALDLPPQRAR